MIADAAIAVGELEVHHLIDRVMEILYFSAHTTIIPARVNGDTHQSIFSIGRIGITVKEVTAATLHLPGLRIGVVVSPWLIICMQLRDMVFTSRCLLECS